MSTKVIKYLNIGLWIMLGVTVILILNLVSNMDNPAKLSSALDTSFYWAYILIGFGAAAILLYSIVQTFGSKDNAKKSIIPLVGLLVVFLLASMMSSSELPQFYGVQKLIDEGSLTPKVSKMVDTGLISVYILAGVAFLSLIFSSVARLWK